MSEINNNEDENGNELVPYDEVSLEEMQMSEQLYHNAGLDPVVDAGLKDHDLKIKQENKFINKVLGPRESDIKGYGEAVARRVAYAVYALMNRQYGGKVGDLRSYIMTLQDERDRANARYDDLMGRVVGILGDQYRDLRTDSRQFMEKVSEILGEGMQASKIDYQELAGKLADIDGLRNQVIELTKKNEALKTGYEEQLQQQKEGYESTIEAEKTAHETALSDQKAQYETALAEQKQTYESQSAEQKSAFEASLSEQQQNYETELAGQKQQHETTIEKQSEDHKAAVDQLTVTHEKAVAELEGRIAGLEKQVSELEASGAEKSAEIARLTGEYDKLQEAVADMAGSVSLDDINTKLGEEMHSFILTDSNVPDMVIDGVGKFIDLRKYLGMAAVKGAESALKDAGKHLRKSMKKEKD